MGARRLQPPGLEARIVDDLVTWARMAGATDIVQQLPQLEALCERLYNSQVRECQTSRSSDAMLQFEWPAVSGRDVIAPWHVISPADLRVQYLVTD